MIHPSREGSDPPSRWSTLGLIGAVLVARGVRRWRTTGARTPLLLGNLAGMVGVASTTIILSDVVAIGAVPALGLGCALAADPESERVARR